MRRKVTLELSETPAAESRSMFQNLAQNQLRIRNRLDAAYWWQIEWIDSRRSPGYETDVGFLQEQPCFRHPNRDDRDSGPIQVFRVKRHLDFGDTITGRLPLRIAMNDEYVESVIDLQHSAQTGAHGVSGRRVHPGKLGCDYVECHTLQQGQCGDVPSEGLVRRSVRQEQGTKRDQSSSEICDPAGAVR